MFGNDSFFNGTVNFNGTVLFNGSAPGGKPVVGTVNQVDVTESPSQFTVSFPDQFQKFIPYGGVFTLIVADAFGDNHTIIVDGDTFVVDRPMYASSLSLDPTDTGFCDNGLMAGSMQDVCMFRDRAGGWSLGAGNDLYSDSGYACFGTGCSALSSSSVGVFDSGQRCARSVACTGASCSLTDGSLS